MVKKPTILLALQDPYLAAIFASQLEREGWEAEVANDIPSAELRAVQLRPAIIILSVNHLTDAANEVRRLRTLPTLLKTKIVLLADQAHHAKVHEALKAGAAEYLLTGHLTPSSLVNKMKRLLAL